MAMASMAHATVWVVALLAYQSIPALSMTITADSSSLRFFIGGLGYCGSRLAVRLRQEFPESTISGCVRSETRKKNLLAEVDADGLGRSTNEEPQKIGVHVLDLDDNYLGLDDAGLAVLSRATHIVQTIAPIADFDRDPLLALHATVLHEASPYLQWVGYLSSTGVYGDHGGNWIDEDSELKCQDAKSLARVKAEDDWRELETSRRQVSHPLQRTGTMTNTRVDCFRCGGIYGPGRGPLVSALAHGTPIPTTQDITDAKTAAAMPKYVNRILVDDICGAIVAAVKVNIATQASPPGSIYNLVDDNPAPRREVVEEANRLVCDTKSPGRSEGRPTPTPVTTTATKIASGRRRSASRNTGNKRCRNQRLKDDYSWEPLAPTYKEGLRICLESYCE